jgi:glycosyltransferase involved in cell wall biosynthesis
MRITVAIPVYNTPPDFLFEAVYSILRQDYPHPFRFFLIDDASDNPDTIAILEYLSERMEVIRMPENVGLAALLNHVLEISDTEYVVRMDSDDTCHYSRISDQVAYLMENPDTDVLGTNLYGFHHQSVKRFPLFQTHHSEFPEVDDDREEQGFWLVNHATVIYRKDAVLAVGGYDESLRREQDLDLWERMYSNGAVFRNLTGCYYAWRRYD